MKAPAQGPGPRTQVLPESPAEHTPTHSLQGRPEVGSLCFLQRGRCCSLVWPAGAEPSGTQHHTGGCTEPGGPDW